MFNTLGFDNVEDQGDEIVMDCKYCGDTKKNFQANIKKGVYHCWVCNVSGKVTDLLISSLDMSTIDASRLLANPLGDIEDVIEDLDIIDKALNQGSRSLSLKRYEDGRFYWRTRGFSKRTIKHYRLMYDSRRERATIPVIQNNMVVAVIGRAIDDDRRPKYLKLRPKGKGTWDKSDVLFGSDSVIGIYDDVYVVEGPLDCVNLYEIGIPNAIALLGKSITWKQIIRLSTSFSTAHIMLDNDTYGKEATPNIAERLWQYMNVDIVKYRGHDPGELDDQGDIVRFRRFVPKI